MTCHAVNRSPAAGRRKPPLLKPRVSSAARMAEAAGGATAECAAVCCCCPCVVAGILVLAVYRVPAGLCRRALRQRRQRRLLKQGKGKGGKYMCGAEQADKTKVRPLIKGEEELLEMSPEKSPEMVELDEEMWKHFYASGFWRSPSQRGI